LSLFLVCYACLLAPSASSLLPSASSLSLMSNDTEYLAISSIQAFSLTHLKQSFEQIIHQTNTIHSIPDLFQQQQGLYPDENQTQLPNFGSIFPWSKLLSMVSDQPNRKLLIMIRHAQAWENLNPTSNSNCEFEYNEEMIPNFDSALSPEGFEQTEILNQLLHSMAPVDQTNEQNLTWFETMGLAGQLFVTSPLTRTLQTANSSLASLPLGAIVASELLRASLGTDVCNFRHSVNTLTSDDPLPYPWTTSCQLPHESLTSLYSCDESDEQAMASSPACLYPLLPFQFPIRPPNGYGLGLISDSDELWRADMEDSSHIVRSLTFLRELFEYHPEEKIVGIVTHSEMISALYESLGEVPYSAKNTQIVPIMIESRGEKARK
jgi:broad specificity phosphatase PhoE